LSTHEDFSPKIEHKGPSDRSFAITFAAVFTLIALAPLIHHRPARYWALGVAAVFLIVATARPGLLNRPNRAWMRLGLLLSRVVSPIVMALMFYLAITPVACVMRLFGRNSLDLGLERAKPSYWIERDPHGPAPESMSQQF
jgi:hypothetical protein